MNLIFQFSLSLSVTENGLVKGAEKVFRGKKVTDDYHQEMNGRHFEEHLR